MYHVKELKSKDKTVIDGRDPIGKQMKEYVNKFARDINVVDLRANESEGDINKKAIFSFADLIKK